MSILLQLLLAAGAVWFTTVAITKFVLEVSHLPEMSDEEWEIEQAKIWSHTL